MHAAAMRDNQNKRDISDRECPFLSFIHARNSEIIIIFVGKK